MPDDLIPLAKAQERLGVSKVTLARLVREGRFAIYQNPLDRRQKLVSAAEVDAAARPRLFRPAQGVKEARRGSKSNAAT